MRAPARAALILALAGVGCAPRPADLLVARPEPVFRGHQEVSLSLPWVVGRAAPIGLCLDTPAGTDTSQWEARLLDARFVAPSVRLDTSVCFEAPVPEALPDGPARLCAVLRDRFDGKTQTLPCLPFRFAADDRGLRALEAGIPAAMAAPNPVERLDALAAAARSQGLAALALRLELIAVYTLRREGSQAARADAEHRLRAAPDWVALPFAARWAGQVAYERATLRLESGADLAGCWAELRTAERSFRVCGDRKWIAVGTKQAEVLSRAGAPAEARERLRFALAQCASAPCDPSLVRAAENTLAWLVASDPDALDPELAAAESALQALLEEEASGGPLERANLLLNLAYVRARRGESPEPQLLRAREHLGSADSSRARELAGWADLAEAKVALRSGRLARAAEIGDRLGRDGETARLQALALSVAAAAERGLGRLEEASDRLDRALALHASVGASRLGQDVPLGPGPRAEDVYAAARVQLERGRGEVAWAILRDLDDEAAPTALPAPVAPALAEDLATLAELERPSSGPRRAQRQAIRRAALDRMQERIRLRHAAGGATATDSAVTFRAFPLDDEVVVLRRTPAGAVELYRRSPLSRRTLVALIQALREAMDKEEPDDARWRALAAPLAEALVPSTGDLAPLTTFAMHGILQEVPLSALPLQEGPEARWLAEATAVAWHTAGAPAADGAEDATFEPGVALFVLDPQEDLGIATEHAGSRILQGSGATREALRASLRGARWLHLDAHARYEPGFPELSTILLADGPVTGQELSAWAAGLGVANLSGCGTGRAPVTADSGRYGISGLLARAGVGWVVGARAALSNALAIEFNRSFYASLEQGTGVPGAYGHALNQVRRHHPASRWAALLLLQSSTREKGGQFVSARTPSLAGGTP